MITAAFVALAMLAQVEPGHDGTAAATLEGRPPASQASPLQRAIDATPPGGTLVVEGGVHDGDLFIERPLRLVGRHRPLLRGSGAGSVVRVRAAGVTVDGFSIDGRGGGDLGRDSSGVHVSAPHVTVRDCTIVDALFGVYLREAHDAVVERVTIRGIPGRDAGEKGSGIHVWNTERFILRENDIAGVRDGLYIQSSSGGRIAGNTARDLRYGLHYMFSDDNVFEDNLFENGAAGTALMYSRRIVFRRNRFVRNRGFASVGLLFKDCEDIVAEDNLIADNARGIFLEGSERNTFRRNVIAQSDVAIVLYDSCAKTVFEGNSFVGNLSPLALVGKRTDTRFAGNYYSDDAEPDLDGDGRSDRPYRLSSVFDHLRNNVAAADLLAQSAAATALAAAERAFPVLDPVPVVDESPLARAPRVTAPAAPRPVNASPAGSVASALVMAFGAAVILRARRSNRGAP